VIPSGVEVFVGLEPIDLRWGFDRLAGLVEERLGRHARSRALFVFFNRRRTSMKVLYYDGSGLCVLYKRLDRGTFVVPQGLTPGAVLRRLVERELEDLLSGVAVEPARPKRRGRVLH